MSNIMWSGAADTHCSLTALVTEMQNAGRAGRGAGEKKLDIMLMSWSAHILIVEYRANRRLMIHTEAYSTPI